MVSPSREIHQAFFERLVQSRGVWCGWGERWPPVKLVSDRQFIFSVTWGLVKVTWISHLPPVRPQVPSLLFAHKRCIRTRRHPGNAYTHRFCQFPSLLIKSNYIFSWLLAATNAALGTSYHPHNEWTWDIFLWPDLKHPCYYGSKCSFHVWSSVQHCLSFRLEWKSSSETSRFTPAAACHWRKAGWSPLSKNKDYVLLSKPRAASGGYW